MRLTEMSVNVCCDGNANLMGRIQTAKKIAQT
jgi:hypothetical protein